MSFAAALDRRFTGRARAGLDARADRILTFIGALRGVLIFCATFVQATHGAIEVARPTPEPDSRALRGRVENACCAC
ncbi:MAG: hypothetical protein ABL900_09330 [Burkholderiaceae bacterium]